jgi:hypothetical protein
MPLVSRGKCFQDSWQVQTLSNLRLTLILSSEKREEGEPCSPSHTVSCNFQNTWSSYALNFLLSPAHNSRTWITINWSVFQQYAVSRADFSIRFQTSAHNLNFYGHIHCHTVLIFTQRQHSNGVMCHSAHTEISTYKMHQYESLHFSSITGNGRRKGRWHAAQNIFLDIKLIRWRYLELIGRQATVRCNHTTTRNKLLVLFTHISKNGFSSMNGRSTVRCAQLSTIPWRHGVGVDYSSKKLIHQPIYALNKIHSKVSIKLLHVSAPRCHHQGVTWTKEYKASRLM